MLVLRKPKALHWTHHARGKMRYYKLSEQRVRRVLHSPKRVEEGIAPRTVAMMQPNIAISDKRQATWRQEIWVMIQNKRQGTPKSFATGQAGDKRQDVTVVISAWRYPGMTKPGAPLPEAMVREVRAGAYALRAESMRRENEAVRERMKGMLKKWRRGYTNSKFQIPNPK